MQHDITLPDAPIVFVPSNYTHIASSEVILKCDVKAYPNPTITWANTTQDLTTEVVVVSSIAGKPEKSTAELRFDTVRSHHAGQYTCTAQNVINGIDMEATATTMLYVECE